MKFQSKWRNALYIVRPTTKTIIPGFGVQYQKGLFAKFKGEQRIFDSVAAQEEHGWTDEEREQVEKHLLSHKDFGHGLYLAPGEELTDEQRGWVRDQRVFDKPKTRCMHVWVDGVEVKQCPNEASVGQEFCDLHLPTESKIVKGMVTSAT
jgi:hypothetical protein